MCFGHTRPWIRAGFRPWLIVTIGRAQIFKTKVGHPKTRTKAGHIDSQWMPEGPGQLRRRDKSENGTLWHHLPNELGCHKVRRGPCDVTLAGTPGPVTRLSQGQGFGKRSYIYIYIIYVFFICGERWFCVCPYKSNTINGTSSTRVAGRSEESFLKWR